MMPLPDEIVEDILLRLDDASDLARASAVCATFRRVAAAPGFLRRFGSLHRPPVLGVLLSSHGYVTPLLHAEPSHRRSAPAARALARAADFTFSFVPRDGDPRSSRLGTWCAWDALDGRVLLSMFPDTRTAAEDLVVCDPLHLRYVQIPPIPSDLVPSNPYLDFEHFLAPSSAQDQDQEKDELSFQVICNVRSALGDEVVTLAFSSVTANWRRATSISLPNGLKARHYVRGCFYWACQSLNYMLVLDPRDMKLTVVKIQIPRGIGTRLAVVDAGQDKLGMATVSISNGNRCRLDLYCKNWWDNSDDGTEDWEHRIIHLPDELGYNWYMKIRAAFDGYLLLEVIQQGCRIPNLPNHVYYILELKTLSFERLRVFDMGDHPACFYSGFPPPLSLPTI